VRTGKIKRDSARGISEFVRMRDSKPNKSVMHAVSKRHAPSVVRIVILCALY